MRVFLWLVLAFFLSMLTAQIVARQIANHFHATGEFIVVMVAIAAFAVVSIAVMTAALIAAMRVRVIDLAASGVAAFVVAVLAGFNLYGMAMNDWNMPSAYDLHITIAILVAALFVVLIQWWFVRWCWRG